MKIPINSDGEVDINLQDLIVEQYDKLMLLKTKLKTMLDKCNRVMN